MQGERGAAMVAQLLPAQRAAFAAVALLEMGVEAAVLAADGRRACDAPLRSWLLTLLTVHALAVAFTCAGLAVQPRPRRQPTAYLQPPPRLHADATPDDALAATMAAGAALELRDAAGNDRGGGDAAAEAPAEVDAGAAARTYPESVYLPLFGDHGAGVDAGSESTSASAPGSSPATASASASASAPLPASASSPASTSSPVSASASAPLLPSGERTRRRRRMRARAQLSAFLEFAVRCVNFLFFVLMVRGALLLARSPACEGGASYVQRLTALLVGCYFALWFLPLICCCMALPLVLLAVRLLPLVERRRRARRAAGEEIIAALPTARYAGGAEEGDGDDAEEKCVICLSSYEAGEIVKTLPCAHEFHERCIDEWMRVDRSCPMCKRDVVGADSAADGGGGGGADEEDGGGDAGGRLSSAV